MAKGKVKKTKTVHAISSSERSSLSPSQSPGSHPLLTRAAVDSWRCARFSAQRPVIVNGHPGFSSALDK